MIQVGFQVGGPCNWNCYNCTVQDYIDKTDFTDDTFCLIEKTFTFVYKKLSKVGIPLCFYLLGGEPTFWKLEHQHRFVELMDKYPVTWAIASNGYDVHAPILEKVAYVDIRVDKLISSKFHPMQIITKENIDVYKGDCNGETVIDNMMFRVYSPEERELFLSKLGYTMQQVIDLRRNCKESRTLCATLVDVRKQLWSPCCRSHTWYSLKTFMDPLEPDCENSNCVPWPMKFKSVS